MNKNKCNKCNGSGYTSAAKQMGMQGYPIFQQPIGVSRCSVCGGSGKLLSLDPFEGLTEEEIKKILDLVEVIEKKFV